MYDPDTAQAYLRACTRMHRLSGHSPSVPQLDHIVPTRGLVRRLCHTLLTHISDVSSIPGIKKEASVDELPRSDGYSV